MQPASRQRTITLATLLLWYTGDADEFASSEKARNALLVTLDGLQCFAQPKDTDGDGLLDVLDVDGFNADASGELRLTELGIEDLDGVNQLIAVSNIRFADNNIASIESGDFEGLTNLQTLGLSRNRITSIESGDFEGLNNLQILGLYGNQITSIESEGCEGLMEVSNDPRLLRDYVNGQLNYVLVLLKILAQDEDPPNEEQLVDDANRRIEQADGVIRILRGMDADSPDYQFLATKLHQWRGDLFRRYDDVESTRSASAQLKSHRCRPPPQP